jgi:signal transduction histidine kinase
MVRKPLLDMIQNAVHRGAEMVQRIREYLRTGQGAVRPLNLCTTIEESVELTRPLWQRARIEVIKRLHPVPNIKADAADLRRVFTNLIINAMEAMPNGGRITIDCEQRERNVVATIADVGVGIPPEAQKKVFFAYFTTKPGGTGLGLSGAQKILLSYGGNISFHSEVGKGTTFTVTLPVSNGKVKAA